MRAIVAIILLMSSTSFALDFECEKPTSKGKEWSILKAKPLWVLRTRKTCDEPSCKQLLETIASPYQVCEVELESEFDCRVIETGTNASSYRMYADCRGVRDTVELEINIVNGQGESSCLINKHKEVFKRKFGTCKPLIP